MLDVSPLATLLAELETAQSSLAASAKEFERLKSLGENTAPRALETAEAAMKRDQAALESVKARLLAGWGKPFTSRTDLAALTREMAVTSTRPTALSAVPMDDDAPIAATVSSAELLSTPRRVNEAPDVPAPETS